MKTIKTLTTGYSRGYVRVAERMIESEIDIEKALKMHKNSNAYQMVKSLLNYGATKITIASGQHSKSSQYKYYVYTGYAD
jgi:hypothetical protein